MSKAVAIDPIVFIESKVSNVNNLIFLIFDVILAS